jgi:uncharacterized Tic20 family protein
MNYEELEKLNELKEKGIITEEEFKKQKEKLLNGDASIENRNEIKGKENVIVNNTINVNPNKKARKVGLLTILGYVIGILLLLGGLSSIFTGNATAGIFAILAGITIIPYFNYLLEDKLNFKLSRTLRIIMFLIFIIALGKYAKTDAVPTTNNNENTHQQIINETVINKETQISTIALDETKTIGNWEVTLIKSEAIDSWEIENENEFLVSYYKADEGNTYIVTKLTVKNIGTESATFGENSFVSSDYDFNALCNGEYKYSMSCREEDYTMSNSFLVEALKTKTAYVYKEVPKEAITDTIEITYKIAGAEYVYKMK